MMDYQYHIFSPYRVCPLGAYVDHQHGLVTGFAIDKGVDLWFNVREDSLVKLSARRRESPTSQGSQSLTSPHGSSMTANRVMLKSKPTVRNRLASSCS